MALCKSCGNQVEESASFCTTCGQPMPASAHPSSAVTATRPVCSGCGAQCNPDSKFCTECGHGLTTEPVPKVGAAVPILASHPPPADEPMVTPTPVLPMASAPVSVATSPATTVPPKVEPAPEVAAPVYAAPIADEPAQPGGGAFRAIVLVLLLLIVLGGLGGWYFMGVETVIVCSPPDVTVFLDGRELAPTSYGRYVIPHLSRQAHLLKVQRAGFADTIEKVDFPLTSAHEWVNIRLLPSRQVR
jgi:hypothetical protein